MKKNFLLINTDACLLGLAQRLEKEGYKTFSWFAPESEKFSKGSGEGMINVAEDLYDVLFNFKDKKNDLIIVIDGNTLGDQWDYLRSEGWKVVGSSSHSEEMEHDRGKGNDLATTLGLGIPPATEFNDFAKALSWLEKAKAKDNSMKLVFKGDGLDLAGSPKTYMADSVDQMIMYVNWLKGLTNIKIEKFRFQKVVDGLEVDFAMWWNGKFYIPGLFLDFEQKKNDGLGQAEGCRGQIEVIFDPNDQPYLKYFKKLMPHLKENKAVANEWAINNIVEEKTKQPFFLEFTPRLGWDSTVGELALIEDAGKSLGEYLTMIADQKTFPRNYFPYGKYACSVRLYTGSVGLPYEEVKGRPVFWDPKYDKNFFWYALKRGESGYEVTGNPVGVCTAIGDTPEEAMAKVYEIIEPKNHHLTITDLEYSRSIGKGVSDKINKLKEIGLLK